MEQDIFQPEDILFVQYPDFPAVMTEPHLAAQNNEKKGALLPFV